MTIRSNCATCNGTGDVPGYLDQLERDFTGAPFPRPCPACTPRRTAVTLPDLARVDREADTIPPGADGDERFARWSALQIAWSRMGDAEQRVLLSIAQRLEMGRRDYGPLAKRGRDWLVELQAELLDAAVYVTAETEGIE